MEVFMQMILLATILLCTTVQPKPVKVKPSPEATFKERWLALHFRELAR